MTKKSVKFYAISNHILSIRNLTGFSYNADEKKYISEFWKIIFSFQIYSWLPFYANYTYKLIERLKGRKHSDVKFTFASHVRA